MKDSKKNRALHKFFSSVVYYFAGGIVILLLRVLLGFKMTCDERVKRWKKEKKAFIMLSSHPSEMDAAVMVAACWPRRARIVAGERQMYRKHGLGPLFRCVDCIPKKQFLPDMHAVREILTAVKNGALLGMMPEGRVSFDGTNSPIDYSTAKLLKKTKVPVAALVPEGTYYVMPPYHNQGLKLGKVTASVSVLLDEGEAEQLSTDEIYERLCKALSYNQSQFVSENHRRYGPRKRPLRNVACMLYRCPKCGAYRTVSDDQHGTVFCIKCGLKLRADRSMQFTANDEGMPANVSEWNAFQLECERKRFEDSGAVFTLPASREILTHPDDEDFTFAANGRVTLGKDGFHYEDAYETISVPLEQMGGVSADYRTGTVIVYREDGTRQFTFDERQGTAEFVNCLMVLREKYI